MPQERAGVRDALEDLRVHSDRALSRSSVTELSELPIPLRFPEGYMTIPFGNAAKSDIKAGTTRLAGALVA
jgi:hypothetical protein